MQSHWQNQTVLITGASSGIGAAFAKFLSGKGLHVIMVARRKGRLRALEEEIQAGGGQVHALAMDLSKAENRELLFKQVTSKFSAIDFLINNAGFGWYGYFHEMPYRIASQMIAINVEAAVHLSSLFLESMLLRGSGRIINIGSVAGGFPNQGVAVYSASKAFLDAFTTSLHRELRGSGVVASVMRLGPVRTEFFENARRMENGGEVPAEQLAVSVEKVNRALWKLLKKPRRAVYVPRWLWFSQLADPFFSPLVDRMGPLLLRRTKSELQS